MRWTGLRFSALQDCLLLSGWSGLRRKPAFRRRLPVIWAVLCRVFKRISFIGMRDCPMRNRLLDAACTLAPGLPSQSALAQRCPVQRGHNVDVGIADDLMAAICQLRTHIPGGCGAHLSAFARRLSLHPASAAR